MFPAKKSATVNQLHVPCQLTKCVGFVSNKPWMVWSPISIFDGQRKVISDEVQPSKIHIGRLNHTLIVMLCLKIHFIQCF
jgi:hypothetical protein